MLFYPYDLYNKSFSNNNIGIQVRLVSGEVTIQSYFAIYYWEASLMSGKLVVRFLGNKKMPNRKRNNDNTNPI